MTHADGPVGLQHRSLRDTVLAELRDAIVSGRLAPGTRLLEDQLAGDLGVSRFPVREALGTLAGEGFVEIVPPGALGVVPARALPRPVRAARGAGGPGVPAGPDRAGPDQIASCGRWSTRAAGRWRPARPSGCPCCTPASTAC